LRVVIRRLKRCIGVFSQFYPGKSWKKLRDQLTKLMAKAAAVRDLDIALGLLAEAGVSPRSAILARLRATREKRGRALVRESEPWKKRLHHWNRKLEL